MFLKILGISLDELAPFQKQLFDDHVVEFVEVEGKHVEVENRAHDSRELLLELVQRYVVLLVVSPVFFDVVLQKF